MAVMDSLEHLTDVRFEREQQIVEHFLNRYGRVLDTGAFEVWPDLFEDSGAYSLTTYENTRLAGLSLLLDRGREALKERAAYVLGYYRVPRRKTLHIISNVLIEEVEGDVVTSHANVVLYRVNRRGESALHVCGEYNDRIRLGASGAKFVEHRVVLDGSTLPEDLSDLL
ncbi:MAG: aromatic-ring-hydroxylating dioxygenase subunit beta [Actinomycetota bacterium]